MNPLFPGRRRRAGQANNANAWMVTFTDLVALMLTFFVMLFAMSTLERQDWQNLSNSLALSLNAVRDQETAAPSVSLSIPVDEIQRGADLDYLGELLHSFRADLPLLERAQVVRGEDRLTLALPADLLFGSGASELDETARGAVYALGGLLRNLPNRIEVAGHADPRLPVARFPSNWELSLLRALAVAEGIEAAGYRGTIPSRGYSHAQFGVVPEGLTEEERQQLGRRVDIIIHEARRDGR